MERGEIIRVAHAEDHISVREGVVDFLHKSGTIAVEIQANNGIEMLDKLIAAERPPDICIIDIKMPEMDGFNLLLEIKKRWPLMRTLILTSYKTEASIIRMIKAGANGYLHKECPIDEIEKAILSIHETGYYYSPMADNKKFTAILSNKTKPLQLTENETTLLTHFANGLTNEEIAQKMNKTIKSIKSGQERLCKKLNVNKRTGLILFAIKCGIIPVDF